MTTKISTHAFSRKTSAPSTCSPRCASCAPVESPGTCQPPRKSAAAIPLITKTLAHSAKKKNKYRIPEYSVEYPATSSLSASGRSKGARLPSARAVVKYRKKSPKVMGFRKTYQYQGQPPVKRIEPPGP